MSRRHYYAGYSYMGVQFTLDCPCWSLQVFDSKAKRDEWVFNMDKTKAKAITAKEARQIDRDMFKAVGTMEFERTLGYADGHLSTGDSDYQNMRQG